MYKLFYLFKSKVEIMFVNFDYSRTKLNNTSAKIKNIKNSFSFVTSSTDVLW